MSAKVTYVAEICGLCPATIWDRKFLILITFAVLASFANGLIQASPAVWIHSSASHIRHIKDERYDHDFLLASKLKAQQN